MKHYRDALKTAIDLGAVPAALNALVSIAETWVERGETERAADIVTLVLCYPLSRDTRDRAQAVYDDLESRVGAHVMADAQARAELMTLEDLAGEVIREMTEE